MKLKQQPDDFRVEERTHILPGETGDYSFYCLEKRGWTTPDALAIVRNRWKIDARRISFGGLKDRHASTSQYLTIQRGPARELRSQGLRLRFLGRVEQPFTSDQIDANAFQIVIRDLEPPQVERFLQAIPEIARIGIPNYFDDQRFGGVLPGNRFVAREMVLGNFETALRMALAEPSEHDRAAGRIEKEELRAGWGDWSGLRTRLKPGPARAIVEYLAHRPGDFRGACSHLNPELQGMALAAWQSHLWNRMLSRWIADRIPRSECRLVRLKTERVLMPRRIPDELRETWETLELPLPSARLKWDASAPWAAVVTAIMEEEKIPLAEMRVPGVRKPFFSRGNRSARIPIARLDAVPREDEANPGRQALATSFELPRGCYATMVLKRLMAEMGHDAE